MKLRVSSLTLALLAWSTGLGARAQEAGPGPEEPVVEKSCPYRTPIENPWCYNFTRGSRIMSPPAECCDYFSSIASFWNGRGDVIQCATACSGSRAGFVARALGREATGERCWCIKTSSRLHGMPAQTSVQVI